MKTRTRASGSAATLASRLLVPAAASLFTNTTARAQTPPPEVLAERPASVASEVLIEDANPSCVSARIRCTAVDEPGAPTTSLAESGRIIAPHIRDLRDCLDRAGEPSAAAIVTIRRNAAASDGGASAKASIDVEQGTTEAQATCARSAAARLADLAIVQSSEAFGVVCAHECDERRSVAGPVVADLSGHLSGLREPEERGAERPQPPTAPPPGDDERADEVWYGWQTLTADGASVGLLSIGLTSWTMESTIAGYSGFLFATPIIHAVHGNVGRSFGSFALRLFVPVLAGGIGVGAAYLSAQDDFTAVSLVKGGGVGMFIGVAGCIAIDAAALSFEQGNQRRMGSSAPTTASTLVLRLGSTIGLDGTF